MSECDYIAAVVNGILEIGREWDLTAGAILALSGGYFVWPRLGIPDIIWAFRRKE